MTRTAAALQALRTPDFPSIRSEVAVAASRHDGDRHHALPMVRTPLIGRRRDADAVMGLLARDDVPLVTLTGPGGVGKTRLAMQVAADLGPSYPDGVRLAELATVREPDAVLSTIAYACGLIDRGESPLLERLIAYLRPRSTLLVLDNVEHLPDTVPLIGRLLSACPGLTILATSRAVLRLSGEHDVPVQPLAAPEAIQLFVARARAANPDFTQTSGNAAAIAAICARLDGLPLALELAAARARVLAPAALIARLEQSLSLLTGGARDLPVRHRTMRDAIAWSYDLLDARDQLLLQRLALLVGGFGLDAADAVSGLAADELLDGIASLVDMSLLTQVGWPYDDEPRYRMLETLREFGMERLEAGGQERAARLAHADAVLAQAAHVLERQFQPGYERWLDRMEAEHDNARSALEWADATGEADLSLALVVAAGPLWTFRGYFQEGRRWLDRALAQPGPALTIDRVHAVFRSGCIATLQGDIAGATALLTASLEGARVVEERWVEAMSLMSLGMVALRQGDIERAMARAGEALACFRAIELASDSGRHYVSIGYANVGRVAVVSGKVEEAEASLREAIGRQRALGFTWGLSDSLRIQGDLLYGQGDHASALDRYRESLTLAEEHGDKRLLADTIPSVARVVAARGEPELAAGLYGAAAALREQIGSVLTAWDRPAGDDGEPLVRAVLRPDVFAAAWAAGAARSVPDLIAHGLAAVDLALTSAVAASRDPAHEAGLTAREVDVLRLIVDGLSNREIAERLSVSHRTVGGHVSNLLGKLGVETRTAAASVALRQGLV